jgi:ribosomal protein S18 acetylase RimI-like enzyme
MKMHEIVTETTDRLSRSAKLKDGRPITLTIQKWEPDLIRFPDETDTKVFLVRAMRDGVMIGYAEFYFYGERSGSVEDVKVEPEYRRLGVATAIYDYLKGFGLTVEPSAQRIEPDGRAFWMSRGR